MKDALGAVQSVLVLGGGSDIGLATVRALVAERTRTVVLAARDPGKLNGEVEALRAAGAETVEAVAFDADDPASHERAIAEAFDRHGDIDVVLVTFGVLGDQDELKRDPAAAVAHVETNFTGAVSAMLVAAQRLRAQGHGALVVLSSVAAERAALELRLRRLEGRSRRVRPGPGRRARGRRRAGDGGAAGHGADEDDGRYGGGPVHHHPGQGGGGDRQGLRRGAHAVWVPPILRFMFAGLRHLPRPLFRRLDL